MSHFKRIPVTLLPLLLVLAGLVAVVAGVHLLAGLAWSLIAGGAAAVVVGLVADV